MVKTTKDTIYIPKAKEIIDNAIKKVKNEVDKIENDARVPKHFFIADKEKKRIYHFADEVKTTLEGVVKPFPNIDKLKDVYKELLLNEIDLETLKKSLSHVAKTKFLINSLKNNYIQKIRTNLKAAPKLRTEFYGRVQSIVKKLDPSLSYILIASRTIRKAPAFKDYPTAVLVGIPNSGKSTFLNKITGSKVEIRDYAFTTKRLQVGLYEQRYEKYQVIDSPGLLVRDFSKLNIIEKQTIIALEKLAKAAIFLIDLTEDPGKQRKLISKLLEKVNKEFIIIYTKKDMMLPREVDDFKVQFKEFSPQKDFTLDLNHTSPKVIEEIKEAITKLLKKDSASK